MRSFTRMILTAALVLGAAASSVQAQTIGFKLGAAFPNLDFDGETTDRMTTFAGGGHIRFGFAGRLGLQAEILSLTKGARVQDTPNEVDFRLEYVEIPVLLHVPLTMGTSFAPYVFAGPSIGLEVRCRVSGGGVTADCEDNANRRSTDLGIHAGAGLAFAMGPGALLIEGRYNHGLSNLNEGTGGAVRTRTPAVMVGYEIPLGRTW